MNLVKYKPFENFLSLEKHFDDLFKFPMFNDKSFNSNWSLNTDVIETDTEITFNVECPGISTEDIKVTYNNNILTISGEKKNENETREGNYHRLERSYGSFSRSFVVPTPIAEDSILAEYNNGIISIKALKTEQSKVRNIEIKTNEPELKALKTSTS